MMAGKPWTVLETRYLRELAGTLPVSDIAKILGRSTASVTNKLSEIHISGRHWKTRLVECPECHQMRTHLARGVCVVCLKQRTQAKLIERESLLMAKLPPESVALKRETSRGSKIVPLPKSQPLSHSSPYLVAKEHDRRLVEHEVREARQLTRENNAIRKRIERLRNQSNRE